MFQKEDKTRPEAMSEMKRLMQTPDAMKAWFKTKRKEFDDLPEGI